MTQKQLKIPKRYKTGKPYLEAYVDDIKNSVEAWALATLRNLNQLTLDVLGTNYSLNNNGVAVRDTPLLDYLAAVSEDEFITGEWTFDELVTFTNLTDFNDVSTHTEDVNLHTNADLNVYSDAGTTLMAKIDSATGKITGDFAKIGIYGGTLSYTSGRLKITANNAVISVTNPLYVTCPSDVTAGKTHTFRFTSDVHFFDDATAADSDIVGEEFSTTAGRAYANSRPFCLYFVNIADTTGYFAISPNFRLSNTPASANNIGYQDSVAATPSDNNMFFLTATNVKAIAVSTVMPIGSIHMTKNASDDWTVGLIAGGFDGIDVYPWTRANIYTLPDGGLAGTASKSFNDNGGTAPVFSSNLKYFQLLSPNECRVDYYFDADGGADGAGAVATQVQLPYYQSIINSMIGSGYAAYNAISTAVVGRFPASQVDYFNLIAIGNSTVALAVILNSNWVAGARTLQFQGTFRPWTT